MELQEQLRFRSFACFPTFKLKDSRTSGVNNIGIPFDLKVQERPV